MSNIQAKVKLELNYPGDGRVFLNFWNWYNGKDVVCQVIEGKLMEDTGEEPERLVEITFPEFLAKVEERVKEWPDK